MATKYYAGRPIQSEGKTYYVGDEVPNAESIRNLHNLLSTGYVYRAEGDRGIDSLPPHVRREVISRQEKGTSAPSNKIALKSEEEARENFENDSTVKVSRAQAELSKAYAARSVEDSKVTPDNKNIRRAAKIFGKSVLDETVAVKPSKEPEKSEGGPEKSEGGPEKAPAKPAEKEAAGAKTKKVTKKPAKSKVETEKPPAKPAEAKKETAESKTKQAAEKPAGEAKSKK